MIYPDKFEEKTGFAKIRGEVKSLCLTPMGRDCVDMMAFSPDASEVENRLKATAQMLTVIEGDEELPLGSTDNLELMLASIKPEGTLLTSRELYRLMSTLRMVDRLDKFFARFRNEEGVSLYPELDATVRQLTTFPMVISAIDSVIDRNAEVKDSASAELASIRSRKQALGGTASSVLRRVMARAVEEGIIDSSATPAMRDGRLVLPLSPMHKRKMPGIVHDESATGKTIFIEPAEVVEVNNRMRELEMEERREINRILIATASLIRPHIPGLLLMAAVIGRLDFIHAKARYAVKVGGRMPRLLSEPDLEWYHARHPVMLAALESRGEEIVPLDITLTPANRILVISGPNAGGKSVVLKTVGVVQYMIQCGLLPPLYENSCAGIFEDIFIDIGDDQSIEDALSTYSSHLRNMKRLIASGGGKSLVLIDEFGAGTEPQIGGALAQAILFRLNQNGVWGVITTHFQNLKRFAEETPGLVNGSMLYDRREMKPLFKLVVGTAGSSFAIEIARNTGLPADIIEMAQEIVGSDYVKMDRYLLDIARDRRYWDNKRNSIRVKEKKLDEILQQYESDAQILRQKRREIIEEANTEAKHIIDSANATIERTVSEIRKAQAEREKTLEARRKLRDDRVALEHVDTAADADNHPLLKKVPRRARKNINAPIGQKAEEKTEIKVGMAVKLDGQGQAGRVTEVNGSNVTVVFGMLKTTVPVARLKPTLASPDKGVSKAASFVSVSTSEDMRSRQLNFKQEIDVRGMRAAEAVQAVTYFIDDAIQFGVSRVRILHGTGYGVLRQYIRDYLRGVNGVVSAHDEDVRFGGAGITVVNLK